MGILAVVVCAACGDNAGPWSEPVVIGAPGNNVQLAVAADGSATVVWATGFGEIRKTLWANHFEPVTGWGEPAAIYEVDGDGAIPEFPLLVGLGGSATGHVVVLVHQDVNAGGEVWALRYEPDAGWGTAARIESTPAENQRLSGNGRLAVTVTDDGVATVAFATLSPDGVAVRASRQVSGGAWSASFSLVEGGPEPSAVRIASDIEGTVMATWTQQGSVRTARLERDAATWTTPELIPFAGQRNSGITTLAAGGPRTFFATAISDEGLWAGRHAPETGWVQATVRDPGEVSAPTVTVDASGGAIVAWQITDALALSSRFDPETGWGGRERITVGARTLQIALAPDGTAIGAWSKLGDDGLDRVWTSRQSPGTVWGEPTQLSTTSMTPLALATDALGRAILLTRTSEGIAASHYTP